MELRQMEYLVTLADERHFTRAAQLMGVSQSGLSAGIRGLEQELGASLFTRTTRRVEPTDAALALLPHARAMLDQERAARDAVVHATRQVSGTLRIGTEQCLGVIDATALIDRFHRRHPQVEIQFRQAGSHELIDLLRADALDVAFVAAAAHLGTLPHQARGLRLVRHVARHDGHAKPAVNEVEQRVHVAHLKANAPRKPARLERRVGERPYSPGGVEVDVVLDGEGLPRGDGNVGQGVVGGAHEHQVLVPERLVRKRAEVRGRRYKGDVEGIGA